MRRCLLFLFALTALAQQTASLVPIPDLTMTGSAVPLTSSTLMVHWCQFTAPTANTASIYWGNSTVTAAKGAEMAPGYGQSIPSSGPPYDTSAVYFTGTSGDKVKATCQQY